MQSATSTHMRNMVSSQFLHNGGYANPYNMMTHPYYSTQRHFPYYSKYLDIIIGIRYFCHF